MNYIITFVLTIINNDTASNNFVINDIKTNIKNIEDVISSLYAKMNSEINITLRRGLAQLRNEFVAYKTADNVVDK